MNTYAINPNIFNALNAIPSHDRDTWVRCGMALKAELGEAGFDLWNTWSQSADSYNPKEAKSVWKSIRESGGVTVKTLFNEAIGLGWRPSSSEYTPPTPEQQRQIEAEKQAAHKESERIKSEQRQAAKDKAVKMWEAAGLVKATHPYVIAKGIKPIGAKQLKNMLLLPLMCGVEIVNLQIINTDESKKHLTGGQVKGTHLVLGSIEGASEALLCEGWATGCTLHEATGLPVVISWNAGNMPTVAKMLAETYPDMTLRVCGDMDESSAGQNAAMESASIYGNAIWGVPLFSDEQTEKFKAAHNKAPSDFNDLKEIAGFLEVLNQVTKFEENREIFSGVTKTGGNTGNSGNKRSEALSDKGCKPSNSVTTSKNGLVTNGNIGNKTSKNDEKEASGNTEEVKKEASKEKPASPFFISEGIPSMRDGVYWVDSAEQENGEKKAPLWICSPLKVIAETRDSNQSNWGRWLQWKDADSSVHSWACPSEILAASDTADFRRELARNGLLISPNSRARQKLCEYVLAHTPEQKERLRCVTKIGWHGSRYVLPSQVFGKEEGEGVIYQGSEVGDYSFSGTLEDWKDSIAAYASDNSRLTFAISVAFAGVLCEMAGESGGGFHFVGTTSKGKTSTLLDPAASVWGNPERFSKKWRATTNGLESVCSGRNDGLLVLDELAQIDPKEAGNAAYLIANGQAKQRMSKDCVSKPVATWRTMLLSAGEIDLAQHMIEGGKSVRGGQKVRLPSIPADAGAGLGTFDTLHDFTTGQALSDHLKSQTRQCYGTAGIAFLEKLTAADELSKIKGSIKDALDQILLVLEIPKNAAPEVGRVAKRFALIAFAGELASHYDITGWSEGEATKAAKKCFEDWLGESGGGTASDEQEIIANVVLFFQQNGSTRFPPFDETNEDILQRYKERTGFTKKTATEDCFLVMTETFKSDICSGYKPKYVLEALSKYGFLRKGTDGRPSVNHRIPALGNRGIRVHIIESSILGGGDNE